MSSSLSQLPQHVAIIMDGNGRWAKAKGLPRLEGHRAGVEKTDEIITAAREAGIGYLTLYAFSKENWDRPPEEVDALMVLLKEFLIKKEPKMLANGIRFNTIGNIALLPSDVRETIDYVVQNTSGGKKMVLTLALSYGSRDEIVRAVSQLIQRKKGALSPVTEAELSACLDTHDLPDPDLVIRTSGEHRISNFLLWQGAYAEFIFEKCFWPDYSPALFLKALEEYGRRERRYGRIMG